MGGVVGDERLSVTKFVPPTMPSGAFVRPRLHDLVEQGTAGALTVVSGPPGSGKTVLMSAWAQAAADPVAWLSLDASDARPRRFWTGVVRALRQVGVEGLVEPDPSDGIDDALGQSVVADIVAAVAGRGRPVVLVLDDFHEVGHAIVPDLDRLLDQRPDELRLVIASRRDPPLRLGRLRLAGQLTEIRASDLACTADEARTLLDGAGVPMEATAAERLWERTEGWVAALVLASIALRSSDTPEDLVDRLDGRDAPLSDYLVHEMLARLPSDVQTFLLKTSIVDVLRGDLADEITGTTGSHARLASLARDGALVNPVDQRNEWFRYHALFRDLLVTELRWRHPEQLTELHQRAAGWYARSGDVGRAIRHAVDGERWDLAADLAVRCWIDLLINGELDVLAPLLDSVPSERLADDASLAVAIAAVSVETEPLDRATARLEFARTAVSTMVDGTGMHPRSRAKAGLALVELLHARHTGEREQALVSARLLLSDDDLTAGTVDPALRSVVLAYLGTAESWTGNVAEAREHLRSALSAANQARSPWLRLQALGYLAGAESTCGDVPEAQRRADQALELARERDWLRTPAAGAAATVAALVATLQCRFDDAADLVAIAERAEFREHDLPIRAAVALPKLAVLASEGRHADALDVARAGLDELGRWPVDTTVRTALQAWEGRLLLAVGDRAEAERVLERATGPEALLVLSTRARLKVDDGEFDEARSLLAPALGLEGPMFRSIVLDLWLVDALALDGLSDASGAAESLERALDLAAPGELLRPIVSHGDRILPLLERHRRTETHHRALVERAISLIETGTDRISVGAPVEFLSERERQVLGYLPTTMSNGEIASALYVSVNTVKTHVRSIYRKLGVESRREAVTRARELGLFGTR
jgi:LuxR family maltose regulon positive regulatory protein